MREDKKPVARSVEAKLKKLRERLAKKQAAEDADTASRRPQVWKNPPRSEGSEEGSRSESQK
jgi:hypothetical protein